MRTLSKDEMKAVSGGQQCPYGSYFSTVTYSCVSYPQPPTTPCKWVSTDSYGNGYWKCN
ncbi:hypothetical protein [Cellvibrio mixtus]|uniref:hypothetical protein n=1 Tax=Cellvibrio mixtus TaxID=39650 RepID=UPI00148382A1|nr:hypothetical protein [Cellvibrio mixtus]